jgi:hypothetical protein
MPSPDRGRIQRGYQTQHLAAEYARQHGFPHTLAVGNGRPGADLTGMLGIHAEVKARSDWDTRLNVWLAQAVHRAGNDLPMLISRPNGYGPEMLTRWPVTFQLSDAFTLLRDAGYGTPDPEGDRCPTCSTPLPSSRPSDL